MILMNLYDYFGCLLKTPCLDHVWSRCKIRKTTLSHWVFLVKLDSSFLIFNTTGDSFYFRSNVLESTSLGPTKNHDVLQERVHAEESAKHQKTNVNTIEELDNTNSVKKETNVISGKTAISTQSLLKTFSYNFFGPKLTPKHCEVNLKWEKIIRSLKILFLNKY